MLLTITTLSGVWLIVLIALAVILIIGTIRVIFRPSDSILDLFLDILLLDLLFDLIGIILSAIGEIISNID